MKKNPLSYWFVAAILLVSITLGLGTLIFGPSKAGANEQLSRKPKLVEQDGSWNPNFLSDCATWFSDHFFLRQELISLDNLISAKIFETSGSDSVVLGKNGWLYYADTLDDYAYTNPMSSQELFAAANNLAMMAEYCEEKGSRFLFALTPNKNSLYPENMPDQFVESQSSNRIFLFEQLDAKAVPYVNLFTRFSTEEEILYFAHDSHWNSKGAALGADLINAGFGIRSGYYQGDFSKAQPHQGDLYSMLYPAFRDREQDPVYAPGLAFTYTGNGKSPDSITLETAGTGEGTLLAYRDSFGNLLYPYLADTFAQAVFSRSTVYDLTGEADFVLIQLVERNLPYLITYVPGVPSPVRDVSIRERLDGKITLSAGGKAPAGCIQLKGKLPEINTGSVFVIGGGIAYEAFLLKDGGFVVNIPEGAKAENVVYNTAGGQKLLAVQ